MGSVVEVFVGIGIGLVGGVLSGLFGIGGGVIIVPVLVALGFTQREASGTSLAALLLPVGLLGVIEYARRHEIRFHYGIGIAIGLLAGVLAGAVLAGRLSNTLLERLFGLLLAIVAFKFILFPTGG
ncbi:MAG TPA: TSUP family transporter [Actinomycetota bacterium]|nr:TSUP family transporter [Actinomycetota bacterium]